MLITYLDIKIIYIKCDVFLYVQYILKSNFRHICCSDDTYIQIKSE